jgi:hypothetical protein
MVVGVMSSPTMAKHHHKHRHHHHKAA